MSNSTTSASEAGHREGFAKSPSPPPAHSAHTCAAFTRQLQSVTQDATDPQSLFQGLARMISQWQGTAAWLFSRTPDDQWTDAVPMLGGELLEACETLRHKLKLAVEYTNKTSAVAQIDTPEVPGQQLVAVPVIVDQQITHVLAALFPSTSRPGFSSHWMMTFVAGQVASWLIRQRAQSANIQLKSLSDFVNLGAALNRAADQTEAAILLVNELRNLMGAQHAALLLQARRGGRLRLAALSDVESIDPESESTKIVLSAAMAAGDSNQAVFWSKSQTNSADDNASPNNLVLHKYCSRYNCEACGLLPLIGRDDVVLGWLLLGLKQQQAQNESFLKYLEQITRLSAGQLDVVFKSQRTIRQVIRDGFLAVSRKRLVRGVTLALLVLFGLMFVPMTYKVKSDCQLQLVQRRFVAAPYAGILEKTFVENGDVVNQGQLLARMDGRQLRVEISGLEADLKSEKKRRDSALARGVVAESQIASAEMKRLESELQLKRDRLNHLEIRSPVDGVVVSGDLEKAEGAPLEMGQNLFEVGPLDQLLVEIFIPESEIQYVQQGMTVQLELSAFPFESFRGEIVRIHPRAEIIENESVFVAKIQIDNSTGSLRPGMKGRAKVSSHRYPLGWNLFHGAWERTRSWLIW